MRNRVLAQAPFSDCSLFEYELISYYPIQIIILLSLSLSSAIIMREECKTNVVGKAGENDKKLISFAEEEDIE